ncbi:MAG TPA: hypothetical protein VLJ17_11840 [Xanthobacteraceae bacterium]|nr:hypothetical protein [Xanthobacteraceae bacterium]
MATLPLEGEGRTAEGSPTWNSLSVGIGQGFFADFALDPALPARFGAAASKTWAPSLRHDGGECVTPAPGNISSRAGNSRAGPGIDDSAAKCPRQSISIMSIS